MGQKDLSSFKNKQSQTPEPVREKKLGLFKETAEKQPAKATKGKKKVGRPSKADDEKLSEKVLVSFTKAERAALEKLADKGHGIKIPLPVLIRALLKEAGNIKYSTFGDEQRCLNRKITY